MKFTILECKDFVRKILESDESNDHRKSQISSSEREVLPEIESSKSLIDHHKQEVKYTTFTGSVNLNRNSRVVQGPFSLLYCQFVHIFLVKFM